MLVTKRAELTRRKSGKGPSSLKNRFGKKVNKGKPGKNAKAPSNN